MKAKKLLKHLAYYISLPVVFWVSMMCISFLFKIENFSLGIMAFVLELFLYLGMPVIIAVLMRFSMLPWVVDPFAALAAPLTMFLNSFVNYLNRHPLGDAWNRTIDSFIDDDMMGFWVLAFWTAWGLIWSFSKRRAKGDHLPGRIYKWYKKRNEYY